MAVLRIRIRLRRPMEALAWAAIGFSTMTCAGIVFSSHVSRFVALLGTGGTVAWARLLLAGQHRIRIYEELIDEQRKLLAFRRQRISQLENQRKAGLN
jgi:hypothetical protein